MATIDGTKFSSAAGDSANKLTNAMILHPIACGLAFLAFLASLGAGVFGSIIAAMIAGVAWIITLVVMAIDFSLFGVRHSFQLFCGRGIQLIHRASRSSRTTSTGTVPAPAHPTLLACGPFWRR